MNVQVHRLVCAGSLMKIIISNVLVTIWTSISVCRYQAFEME